MIIGDFEKRRRRLLRAAGALEGKVFIGPERVYIPITNRCNLSCRYCWFHSPGNPTHQHPPLDMPFKKFQEIVRDCIDLKVDSLYISGEGEPTLHPQFGEMMSFLEKLPIAATLFTNGTFSRARCDDVLKADEVIINLGAVDREGYRLLQGEDLFEKVIENIRRLVRFRDSDKSSFLITIDYVINKMNIQQRHKAEAMLKKLRVGDFRTTALRECSFNRGLRADTPEGRSIGRGKPSPRCVNGWFFMIATLDGKLRYCFQRTQWEIVSLAQMSLREAWVSRKFMKARLEGKSGRLGERFEECQNCLYDGYNIKWGSKRKLAVVTKI